MRTVMVKAANLRSSDVLNGQRIIKVHKHTRRTRAKETEPLDHTGVLVIAPQTDGYGLDAIPFVGSEMVKVKRPLYNMTNRRTPK